ncbi:hypothetical protein TTHERM_00024340 (macronuclear) [Tetrahymena thermophila SB210]|uniref:Uncharacterized protein n=1 Tax=Tetrahymena thermophila (strain SB210) TaxID=312017 RepID=Q22R47_TETTS|nr:hypothetical protein TTHERM_00024340 [Tetrahymena thermophila SB210]EAR88275.2 hypothetical protein TTHERM_00024340 [Tetrahymena thermophila SB210]|eukprot:XP_001008520.2 hypothetical protein TTHERM_00024340 [Tetrahymena thermophila SB210]
MFFHHYDIKNKYQSPFTRAANYTLKPLESPSYANIFNQIKQNQTADTDNIPQQYSYLQNNSYISGTGQLNTQRGYNDYMANQYNSDRNMNVNNPYKKEFFYRIQSPRNPFLPHFDQEEQKESPRLRNIKNGVSGGYEGNENKYGQIKSFNAFNYDELNSSLNHQDQAKLNRAINMGWIPQKQVDQFRSDKNKQLLYQQELQKQINEKQELKMQQLRKQKLEEEKLDRKIMKQLNIPKLDLNSVQMVQKQNQIYDSNVYSKTPSKLSRTPPFRKNSNSQKSIPKHNDDQYLQIQKNRSSFNNIQMPTSPRSNLSKAHNPAFSPRQITKIHVVASPSHNSINTNRPNNFSSSRETESNTQLGLELIKRQMQESYLNASKQLDELKVEMERIREQKNQAQQEFFQLRSQIKNQIEFHNLKLYGGVNFAKNPSKYYQQQLYENQIANNDSSIIYPFISESTLDQNLFQYSQSVSSKTLKQSLVQTPQILNSQKMDNQQQANLSELQSKDLLGSKLITQQELGKIEQNLNESRISRVSHQSKKSILQNQQDGTFNISKDQEKELLSLKNSQIQDQKDILNNSQKDISKSISVKRISSPPFDQQKQESQLDISKELNGENFFFTEINNESNTNAQSNNQDNFKKSILHNSIENNKQQTVSQKQSENDFKKLIKNIEDMVEEQTKDIQNVSTVHKVEVQNSINFRNNK